GGCPWKRLSVDVTTPPAPARPRVSRRGRANPATGTGHARRRPATPGNACTCRGVRGKARHRPAPPGTAGHRLAPPGPAWHRLAPTGPDSARPRPQCSSLRQTPPKLKPSHGEGWKLRRMDPKKRKVYVALVLVGVVLVYLIATAASNTTMYYLTVAEAVERQDDLRGRFIRVAGEVPGDSIQWAAQDFLLTFDVVQGDDRVSAVYRGVRPDNLIDGANVVLEGTFGADGVFTVDRLLVQCVSKYEAAVPEGESPVEYIEIDGVLYESYPSSGGRVR